jgi:hypothetical protein
MTDGTFQIIFNTWHASINVGLKCLIAWKSSRYSQSWPFSMLCRIEDTSNPGIRCMICYPVLQHTSEHMISSMGIHLLAKVQMAKSSELTESEVSELKRTTVDETALAIANTPGSHGITIVRLQKKLSCDSFVVLILTSLAETTIKTSSTGHPNFPN